MLLHESIIVFTSGLGTTVILMRVCANAIAKQAVKDHTKKTGDKAVVIRGKDRGTSTQFIQGKDRGTSTQFIQEEGIEKITPLENGAYIREWKTKRLITK